MMLPEPSPTAATTRVLVVDGESQLVRGLTILLRGGGHVVESARSAAEALVVVAERPPDALLLGLAPPSREAIEICSEVRRFSNVPILLMSGSGAEREKRLALDAGGDDYVGKPFRADELLGRLNWMLAGSVGFAASSSVEIGELIIDLVGGRVTRAGAVLLLERSEFDLVRVLALRPGRLVTDRELLRAVWGDEQGEGTHRLRVAVARLRSKLERDPARPRYLIAEPGIGYRLSVPREVMG